MKLEPGKRYRTRDGREARVIGIWPDLGKTPYAGFIGEDCAVSWTSKGFEHLSGESPRDLVSEIPGDPAPPPSPRPPSVWGKTEDDDGSALTADEFRELIGLVAIFALTISAARMWGAAGVVFAVALAALLFRKP